MSCNDWPLVLKNALILGAVLWLVLSLFGMAARKPRDVLIFAKAAAVLAAITALLAIAFSTLDEAPATAMSLLLCPTQWTMAGDILAVFASASIALAVVTLARLWHLARSG